MNKNWLHVAEFIRSKKCDENRKCGGCGCKNRRKQNPCQKAEALAQQCESLDRGGQGDVAAIIKWVGQRHCRFDDCQHKGCMRQEEIMQFLEYREAA